MTAVFAEEFVLQNILIGAVYNCSFNYINLLVMLIFR